MSHVYTVPLQLRLEQPLKDEGEGQELAKSIEAALEGWIGAGDIVAMQPIAGLHLRTTTTPQAEPARKEWLCEACDWIGSPEVEPTECPNCHEGGLSDITIAGEGGA